MLFFPKMALPRAEEPWRFDRDLDMAVVSWFFYDGNNRGKVSRIKKRDRTAGKNGRDWRC